MSVEEPGRHELDELAELAELLGLPQLPEEEQAAVLDLTRVVAHGVRRRFGPLTAYALGLAMSTRSDPADRTLRVRRAIEVITDRTAGDDGPDEGDGEPGP